MGLKRQIINDTICMCGMQNVVAYALCKFELIKKTYLAYRYCFPQRIRQFPQCSIYIFQVVIVERKARTL